MNFWKQPKKQVKNIVFLGLVADVTVSSGEPTAFVEATVCKFRVIKTIFNAGIAVQPALCICCQLLCGSEHRSKALLGGQKKAANPALQGLPRIPSF